jgi:hypothetical protein
MFTRETVLRVVSVILYRPHVVVPGEHGVDLGSENAYMSGLRI